MPAPAIEEKLAKLRITIARYGEMDRAKWWNTKGLLSPLGEAALKRGFHRTHVFARAKAVFAVAGSRSQEVFDLADTYTLWRLPVQLEDQLEDAWAKWLEDPEPWAEFLAAVDDRSSEPLLTVLEQLELVSSETVKIADSLRRADDMHSVPIISEASLSHDAAIELLAAAHACSEKGKLAVPYIAEKEFAK